jgi:hypothetical protein
MSLAFGRRARRSAVAVAAVMTASVALIGSPGPAAAASTPHAPTTAVPPAPKMARPADVDTYPSRGVIVKGAVYAVGCYTTLAWGASGYAMVQWYANCAWSTSVTVCPAWSAGPELTVYEDDAETVLPYDGKADWTDTAYWTYSATVPGARYTTVYC